MFRRTGSQTTHTHQKKNKNQSANCTRRAHLLFTECCRIARPCFIRTLACCLQNLSETFCMGLIFYVVLCLQSMQTVPWLRHEARHCIGSMSATSVGVAVRLSPTRSSAPYEATSERRSKNCVTAQGITESKPFYARYASVL